MANDNLKATIETRINDIGASEATTKTNLGIISRELLMYVPDTGDIGMVNRLLGVLTKSTHDYAILFFSEHLPWTLDEKQTFGKKSSNAALVAKKLARTATFLAKEENTIWTWAKANVQAATRVIDYGAGVKSAIERALDKAKGNMSKAAVAKLIVEVMSPEVLAKAIETSAKKDDSKANLPIQSKANKGTVGKQSNKRSPVTQPAA